jgi:hypothetical protein
MRLRSWITLGLLAYVAFALSLFPAASAYRWFAPPQLRLAAVEGTLWSGRAALGSAAGLGLNDIRWRLDPLGLLTGRLSGRLETRLADGFVRTSFSASLGGLTLSNLQATTSLAGVRPLLPPTLRSTEGMASLQLQRFELDDGWPVDAVGAVRLAQLAVRPPISGARQPLLELGGYRLDLADTGGEGLSGTIEDTGGPLEVAGTITLGTDRTYRLEGVVRPRPGAPAQLVQGLALMSGEPDAAGKRKFALSGSL